MKIIALVLVLSASVGCHSLRREEICQSNAKCIWLNKHLRTVEVSLHGSVCATCKPEVFCYEGSLTADRLQHIWDSLYITVQTSTPHNLAVTCGNSSQDVLTSAPLPVPSAVWLSPFTVNCVGVRFAGSSDDATNFKLTMDLRLRLMYPVLALLGVLLIFIAPSLSRNVPLIYGTGVTLGILASVLVLLYILSRYMPGKGFLGLGFLAGGYSAVAAIVYWAMGSMTDILLLYWEYVLGYAIIAGLVSFAIIYRWGGVSNPRTFDLIQWSLQLVGMVLVYLSTSSLVLSLGVMVLVAMVYALPLRWTILLPVHILKYLLSPLLQCLKLTFIPSPGIPPKRLLTQEEYEEQGRVETERALVLLKKHCEQHEEDITPSLLNTSRAKMKRFIHNGRHVSEEEEVNHDWTFLEDSDDDDNDASLQTPSPHPSTSSSPSPPRPPHQTFRSVSLRRSHSYHTVS